MSICSCGPTKPDVPVKRPAVTASRSHSLHAWAPKLGRHTWEAYALMSGHAQNAWDSPPFFSLPKSFGPNPTQEPKYGTKLDQSRSFGRPHGWNPLIWSTALLAQSHLFACPKHIKHVLMSQLLGFTKNLADGGAMSGSEAALHPSQQIKGITSSL
eukprot:1158174-Pelagomonas_calceolata.AAC.10